MTRRLLLNLALPGWATMAVFADDSPPKEPKSLFDEVFPNPTGTNGYEEIVRAGERLRAVKAAYPPAAEFTLAKKRAYLNDPAARQALLWLRQGLAKNITVPESDPTNSKLFATFALLRALARLLSVHIYVALADGRNDVAVRSVADGLLLSRIIGSLLLIGNLVSRAIDAIVLTTIVRQRNSWSVSDCQRLRKIAEQWLSQPDPTIAALVAERQLTLKKMEEIKEDLPGVLEGLPDEYEDETASPSPRASYAETMRSNPTLQVRVYTEMIALIQLYFDHANRLLQNPGQPIKPTLVPDAERTYHPITLWLRGQLLPDARTMVQKGIEGRVSLQLLAVQASIRRFQWENERLPKTLDELELPSRLSLDPLTGESLLYTSDPTGSGYQLASAGILIVGEDGKPGTRVPITLPLQIPKS